MYGGKWLLPIDRITLYYLGIWDYLDEWTVCSSHKLDMIAGEEILTMQLRTTLTNQIIAPEKGKKLLRVWRLHQMDP